jgi:hypothetical protein
MARIEYPSNTTEWAILFGKMKAKDDADGAASILNPYKTENAIDMTVNETNMRNSARSVTISSNPFLATTKNVCSS